MEWLSHKGVTGLVDWLNETGITFDAGVRGTAVLAIVYATVRYVLKLYDVVILRLENRRDEDAEAIEKLGRELTAIRKELAAERRKSIRIQSRLGVAIYQLNLHGVQLPPNLEEKGDVDVEDSE